MKIELWAIGKTNESYLEEGIQLFQKRLKHYVPFHIHILADVKQAKNLNPIQLKQKEGEIFLNQLTKDDFVILLDERGKQLSSVEFSAFLEQKMTHSLKKIVFIIGGAYGFSDEMYQRANDKISLSKMTFSHQMIRLFFIEQIYRAFTILKNEPYHNE